MLVKEIEIKALEKALEEIAQKRLCIDTLEEQGSDGLDFHEVAVWSLKEALEEAYKLGKGEVK